MTTGLRTCTAEDEPACSVRTVDYLDDVAVQSAYLSKHTARPDMMQLSCAGSCAKQHAHLLWVLQEVLRQQVLIIQEHSQTSSQHNATSVPINTLQQSTCCGYSRKCCGSKFPYLKIIAQYCHNMTQLLCTQLVCSAPAAGTPGSVAAPLLPAHEAAWHTCSSSSDSGML
jgi:hypothetical protein